MLGYYRLASFLVLVLQMLAEAVVQATSRLHGTVAAPQRSAQHRAVGVNEGDDGVWRGSTGCNAGTA